MLSCVRRHLAHSVLHGHTISMMEPQSKYNASACNPGTAVHDYMIAGHLCFTKSAEQLGARTGSRYVWYSYYLGEMPVEERQ